MITVGRDEYDRNEESDTPMSFTSISFECLEVPGSYPKDLIACSRQEINTTHSDMPGSSLSRFDQTVGTYMLIMQKVKAPETLGGLLSAKNGL